MYLYTLGFIKRKDEVLLLNRNYAPWMGCWNGIGGKLLKDEKPIDCIIRECYEETGIEINKNNTYDKGVVTWNNFNDETNGLYLYLINLSDDFEYKTPISTKEGILEWKKIDWILDKNNLGLSANIPYFIKDVLYNDKRYNHKCYFNNNNLIKVERIELNE